MNLPEMVKIVAGKKGEGLSIATKKQVTLANKMRGTLLDALRETPGIGTDMSEQIIMLASIEKPRVGNWLAWGRTMDLAGVCQAAAVHVWLPRDGTDSNAELATQLFTHARQLSEEEE